MWVSIKIRVIWSDSTRFQCCIVVKMHQFLSLEEKWRIKYDTEARMIMQKHCLSGEQFYVMTRKRSDFYSISMDIKLNITNLNMYQTITGHLSMYAINCSSFFSAEEDTCSMELMSAWERPINFMMSPTCCCFWELCHGQHI